MPIITVYKKVLKCDNYAECKFSEVIVTAEVDVFNLSKPAGTGKCRAKHVKVVDISQCKQQLYSSPKYNYSILVFKGVEDALWKDKDPPAYSLTPDSVRTVNYTKLCDGDVFSYHKHSTRWIVGDTVYPDYFNDDANNICTGGIHVFLTREEAESYSFV